MKQTFKTLSNIEEINLDCHALIEASAGTGKTYTIENLVLRLLIEQEDLKLKNILIVTFTEKATNELKFRIREKLINTVCLNQNLAEKIKKKLNNSLDFFDEAQIFTIHGFCNNVLRDFAFEVGILFNQTLVDDKIIFDKLIRKQMSEEWPNIYGNKLNTMLTLSTFNGHKDGFISDITNLALNDTYPEIKKRLIFNYRNIDLDNLWASILNILNELQNLIGTNFEFSKKFSKLNINMRSKKTLLRDIVIPLEKMFAAFNAKKFDISITIQIVKLLEKKVKNGEVIYKKLSPTKWLKLGNNIEVCSNLNLIDAKLSDLVEYFLIISNLLYITTLDRLLKDSKKLKRSNGWISYKDMLKLANSFLYNKTLSFGLNKLRDRYKFAFVDEFQDSDPLQWSIFKKIFLDYNHNKQNKLFLIGDPKQAIYSFRGADIFTYFEAREKISNLATKNFANIYYLEKNWRSVPKLQKVLNVLFSSIHWFKYANNADFSKLEYKEVKSPREKYIPSFFLYDQSYTNSHSFNIVDLTHANSIRTSRQLLAEFVCKKIKKLINNPNIIFFRKNGNKRQVCYNDICILVRGTHDFKTIKPFLTNNQIPYSYYKKIGLFQSSEAKYLSTIFHAILNPEKSSLVKLALLTPFFNISIQELSEYNDIPWQHPVNNILKLWGKHAKNKNWSKLFTSIMEDSGFIIRHCNDYDWSKVEINFSQLFEYLEFIANEKNITFYELVELLDKYRHLLHGEQLGDANLQQSNGIGTQVQIMTIHSSKGLEFPIVFVIGGFTKYHTNKSILNPHKWLNIKNKVYSDKKINDLINHSNLELYSKEYEEEKRLFYVALTRAKLKVYVPYYPIDSKLPWVGPICQFIANSIDDTIKNYSNDDNLDVKWHTPKFSFEINNLSTEDQIHYDTINQSQKSLINHYLQTSKYFGKRIININSFSKIISHPKYKLNYNKLKNKSLSPTKINNETNYLSNEIIDMNAAEINYTINFLPSNDKIGSMLHDILENISFESVMRFADKILLIQETRLLIEKYMRVYNVEHYWIKAISKIIVNTLTTPVYIDKELFFLGQLNATSRKHEVEFYFPINLENNNKLNKIDCTLQSTINGETFIHGFIDMLFSFKGKIYIVDWKSNRLKNCYEYQYLKSSVLKSKYDIQYKIYTIATLKWLKQSMRNKFDPKTDFGGVFYFYLRGMGTGNQNGIYYVDPSKISDIQTLEENVRCLINNLHNE